ncbi:HNH endonuclease family protein [Intestinimonas butyriciproducens]|uniref:HNH endonuclease family protein n=1 Tax=Intestinimonas butyriciproducens TaxID=1297617 RepID=UPI004026AB5B
MKIEPKQIKIREVFDGYADQGDDGVFAYGGRLAIRPPYQREFVYDNDQAESVIQTVLKGFPLNVMYWVKASPDSYEVLDGQQRTLSVMQYLKHQYPITLDGKKYYWDALPDDSYDAIMNYEFMVYICEGKESEKLEWFRVVNIAGAKLTEQELRNSVYTGAWLSDAKRYFSKRNCAAKLLSDKYITGDPNRQELLEKALWGICEYQGISEITEYMARYKSDADADELWQYFQDVIHWVEKIFPKYFLDMKGLDWCHLYNEYHNFAYNSSVMAAEVKRLHEDEDVQKPKGIYEFLLCRDTDPFAGRLLNLRAFDKRDKLAAYSRQNGICPICGEHFAFEEMEGDHIKPWSKGGQTTPDNCQMLCKACNGKKTDKY